mgnify:CR=1 FL=1
MKKVMITGATSGIGQALLSKYHGEGHQVIACGRDKSKLAAIENSCSKTCLFDLTKQDEMDRMDVLETKKAAAQVLSLAKDQQVVSSENTILKIKTQSICIHGDNPKVAEILETIGVLLRMNGIEKKAF